MTVDTESSVLARLMEQGREQGADLLTLRALAEEASELGADQRRPSSEVLRAMLCPYLELAMMRIQGVPMQRLFAGRNRGGGDSALQRRADHGVDRSAAGEAAGGGLGLPGAVGAEREVAQPAEAVFRR